MLDMQEGATTPPRYVVRGARMQCTCGSNPRRINLPRSHGSFVNGKPIMNETDGKPHENIPHFGACQGERNPSGETVYFIAEIGETITGKPCMPEFLDKWVNTKGETKVDSQPALTTDSLLVCNWGGVIYFRSDGQHDE
ncbi:DUF4280 domain-containing protein [Paenibacillus sp. MZ04-78.2]|uniref:DUF4280 domain-containing protein n=1 Tax=Paenibacillus sp. MZ04-78.2 TaxID=2962034 RepID=UPI0020B641FB|nr:DUF4280 domain-containing protein [Paenibacillus sp. MZ04-78.2]MCP3774426.1 DUF4280 domain-containing protein [Paenibacillus sp. MZ04-78.2]